ncbi:MAG TPA: exonuclease domain-containing protein [Acidimicrobiales bacterium]|nr:exonuclease domain-containing protein [Acidimicrobiales bacterium]
MVMWAAREVLGFDFETTGVDRFNDVPVSYALVSVVAGDVAATTAELVDPGRDIPAGATEVHGISSERARAEGIPLGNAVMKVADAVIAASQRRVPLAGMKLDYDLTILDTQLRQLTGVGLVERGWCGPVLDAVVLDRHLDRFRAGSRTLGSLCNYYGVDIGNAHDATADAVASVRVLIALSARYKEMRDTEPPSLHELQIEWHQDWARSYDEWRFSRGMAPMDPRDYVWPVAPAILPAA